MLICIPQGSNCPFRKPSAFGFAVIHRVMVQVISLWPDMTVGTWNAEPRPNGVWILGLRRLNSGSSNRLNGLLSTAPSQPIFGGGLPCPQPEFSKLYDTVVSFATSRGFSFSDLTGFPVTGLSTQ